MSALENDFSQNASSLFRSEKLTRPWGWTSRKMTFLKMPAPFFARVTHSSVRMSDRKNDFSQNANSFFRSEKSLDHEAG